MRTEKQKSKPSYFFRRSISLFFMGLASEALGYAFASLIGFTIQQTKTPMPTQPPGVHQETIATPLLLVSAILMSLVFCVPCNSIRRNRPVKCDETVNELFGPNSKNMLVDLILTWVVIVSCAVSGIYFALSRTEDDATVKNGQEVFAEIMLCIGAATFFVDAVVGAVQKRPGEQQRLLSDTP